MKNHKVNQKDYIKGYENGGKSYRRMKGRFFNEKYIPKSVEGELNRLDYINGWYTGWDNAQKEDITINL